MTFSTPGVVIGLVLAAGVVMAPIRAFQALAGRLVAHSSAVKAPTGAITTLFLLAFLFWLAVIWAAFNIEIRRSCSGDNCIGYMLLAMPFPFVYGLAEVLLFRARRSSSPGQPPGTSL